MVLLGTLLLVVIALLIPGQPREKEIHLPWQIRVSDTGESRVFGLTLGQSTLEDARRLFREEPEISMFLVTEASGWSRPISTASR